MCKPENKRFDFSDTFIILNVRRSHHSVIKYMLNIEIQGTFKIHSIDFHKVKNILEHSVAFL